MAETVVNGLGAYKSGSTEPWATAVIASVIRAKKPSIVIETGTFEGLGTLVLLEAMNTYAPERLSRLYTVEMDGSRLDAAWEKFTPYAGAVDIQGVRGDALLFLQTFGGQADVIFLDDDHTQGHVAEEIAAALKILRPGGVVFVHDVVGVFGLGEIVRGFGGVVLDLPRLHLSGGLGILTK